MSLFEEKKGNVVQENFQAGKKKIYLRNKDKPESIRIENAMTALNYLKEKTDHYSEIEHQIVMMLPQKERDPYIIKRVLELDGYSDKKLISSLSEAKQFEYLEKRDEELQTRLRQLKEELPAKKIKPKILPQLTTPLINKINQYVVQHAGFEMKEKKNFEEFLKEIEKDLKND